MIMSQFVRASAVLITIFAATTAFSAEVTFKKTTLDTIFRSEGVATGDFNKDGKKDICVGDYWYAAPDWKRHELRPPKKKHDKRGGYTEAFGVYADDFNKDGFIDVLVVPFHGKDCLWYENPKSKFTEHWKERVAFKATGNETRIYDDVFGDGKKVFLMGVEGQIAWVEVPADATGPWTVHPIGSKKDKGNPAHKFAHGLGFGDVNGDGNVDVMHAAGWYEGPKNPRSHTGLWKHHATKIGPDKYADMFTTDLDGDGRPDILSSSAHGVGIFAHLQAGDKAEPDFKSKSFKIHKLLRETHGMHYRDIDGDGKKDLITGRRFCAHGYNSKRDAEAAELSWFTIKTNKGAAPSLIEHRIDEQSGIGAQFEVSDFNGDGKLDIICSGRKGVYLFIQSRK
jgi:hypothetical protein